MTSTRALKVADRIKEIVAEALESRVRDLQQASIFYTVLGDEAARSATAIALNSARGMLRTEVGRTLGLRITPSLEFFQDGLQESATAMNDLLFEVARKDAELAKAREGAKPAGDADPYKHTEE